jgi:phosphotransferase system HPr-like phosphotransfer protein
MEYHKTFEVKGKYGCHAGPSVRIHQIVSEYGYAVFEQGDKLEVEFIKEYCPFERNVGEKTNPFLMIQTLSLFLIEGSKIKIVAKLNSDNPNKKKLLETCVQEIGEIITNVDKFTFRQH